EDPGDRAAEYVVARKVGARRVSGVDIAGLRGRQIEPDARLIGSEVGRAGMVVDVVRPGRSADIAGPEERRAADRQARNVRTRLAAQRSKEGIGNRPLT